LHVDECLDAVISQFGGEHRPGQHEMARAVSDALQQSDHLFVQAGTGTGKSMGYLVPAAIFAVETGLTVVVATATLALQRQLVERDLPALSAALEPIVGRKVTYAVLKGRANYICRLRLDGSADEPDAELFPEVKGRLEEQAADVREWASTTTTGDRDEYPKPIDARVWSALSVTRRECIGESKCAFGEECFAALGRMRALEADIVVTNHAMLAIDAMEGVPVLPDHGAVIIDEGHELIDRVTTALSMTMSPAGIDKALQRARPFMTPEGIERLVNARDAFDDAMLGITGQIHDVSDELGLALRLLMQSAVLPPSQDADPGPRQRAQGAIEEIHDACAAFLKAGSSDVMWADEHGRIHLAPLDISGQLRQQLFDRAPVIVTSATLTTGSGFGAMVASCGLPESTSTRDVGSPFDYERQGILYVASHLPSPGRDGVSMEGLDLLANLIEAAGGRTLALFSSWVSVERAADYLNVRLGDSFPILVQRKSESVGPLLDHFSADPRSTLIGTMGLWQGVDVPGAACTCVVIDRIPFPRPDDPLTAARQKRIDAAGGSGFRHVSLPRAALMLAQGSGRLIRTPEDRGVVAVLDSRLATAQYGTFLRASMPPFWYTTDEEPVLGALRRLDQAFSQSDEAH
jgi:ATP-dependent DNA helicase DinG